MKEKEPTWRIMNMLGAWSFLVGVLLALLFSIFHVYGLYSNWGNMIFGILFVIGLLIGLLNIEQKEAQLFLYSTLSLVIVSYMWDRVIGSQDLQFALVGWFDELFKLMMILFAPATVIVALKTVFGLAKD
jgi:hypothetical protein